MIYCLGEGAGAGGWSPSMPAPGPLCVLAAAGPRTSKAEGLAWGLSLPAGHGARGIPLPLNSLWSSENTSLGTPLSELSKDVSHIP